MARKKQQGKRRLALEVVRQDAMLSTLARERALADAAERRIVSGVTSARSAGHSWTEIGVALGVSRQAVRQRYGAAVEIATETIRARAS